MFTAHNLLMTGSSKKKLPSTVLTTIAGPSYPTPVVFSPNGSTAWIGDGGAARIAVVDVASLSVSQYISLASYNLYSSAMSPDGSTLWAALLNNTVVAINTSTKAVTDTISVNSGLTGICASTDGSTVWVNSTNSVQAISTSTKSVTNTISVSGTSQGIAISPNGSNVWVGSSSGVAVISTSTKSVTKTITTNAVQFLTVAPNSSKVWATNGSNNAVTVIDAVAQTNSGTFSVGTNPNGIVVTSDGSTLYVANYGSKTVSVVDTSTNATASTISLGKAVKSLALSPDESMLWATHPETASPSGVTVIN